MVKWIKGIEFVDDFRDVVGDPAVTTRTLPTRRVRRPSKRSTAERTRPRCRIRGPLDHGDLVPIACTRRQRRASATIDDAICARWATNVGSADLRSRT